MSIYENMATFAGYPIVDWEPGDVLDDPATTIPRIRLSYEDSDAGVTWNERWFAFLETPGADQIAGLVVGAWQNIGLGENHADAIVEALVAARERVPNLRALFVGDITAEESEISWIELTDLSPVLAAYPALEYLGVRGGNGLSLGRLRHQHLQSLTLESGGLPARVVREITAADLPALTHLELWLGVEDYGGDATIDDLMPILNGDRFPALEYLGLRNSEQADAIAEAVATAPVLDHIQVLDISLGTLTDTGLDALIASPAVGHLKVLDIHHHFCSPAAVERLDALSIEYDASEPLEPEEYDGEVYRYVSVSE